MDDKKATPEELEAVRADLEPVVGREIEGEGPELADALVDAIVEADGLAGDLLANHGGVGAMLAAAAELEQEAKGCDECPEFDEGQPTDEGLKQLAGAVADDNHNALGSALAKVLASPVPSKKPERMELATAILAGAFDDDGAEDDDDTKADAQESQEASDGAEDEQTDTKADGDDEADDGELDPIVLQIRCNPPNGKDLFNYDILINPPPKIRRYVTRNLPHSVLPSARKARELAESGGGRINRTHSRID